MRQLETWLSRATKGLSPESTAQVEAEIRDHYQSAYEAAISRGAWADLVAIQALGDPAAANQQYRKVLLTSGEALTLKALARDVAVFKRTGSVGRAVFDNSFVWLLMVEVLAIGWAFASHDLPFGTCMLANAMSKLPRLIDIDTVRKSRIYRGLKFLLIIGGAVAVAWFDQSMMRLLFYMYVMILPCLTLLTEYRHMSLRRKLPVDRWPQQLYW